MIDTFIDIEPILSLRDRQQRHEGGNTPHDHIEHIIFYDCLQAIDVLFITITW